MKDNEKRIIDWVLHKLETSPDEWRGDGYRVRHESGVWVWIANSYYGVSIGFDDENWMSMNDTIGGVTGWSSFFGPFIPWRRKVFDAAMKVRNRKDALYDYINDYERKKNASLKVVK